MDGFSGTKCGTGLQKKWWGDKEPSDKSSIWYKGGCPFVYDVSTKSWVPQSTSGGGGSLTKLALLKAFIDAVNYNGYDYTGVTIGVRSDAGVWDSDADVTMKYFFDQFLYYSAKYRIIAFDTESGLFSNVCTNSGTYDTTRNYIFLIISPKSSYTEYNSIVLMPDPSTDTYKTAVQNLINAAHNGTAVNYDDLK